MIGNLDKLNFAELLKSSGNNGNSGNSTGKPALNGALHSLHPFPKPKNPNGNNGNKLESVPTVPTGKNTEWEHSTQEETKANQDVTATVPTVPTVPTKKAMIQDLQAAFDAEGYQAKIRAMLELFRQTKPKGWQAITKNKPDTWREHLAACRKADQAYQNKDGQGVIDALAEAESTFNQLIQPVELVQMEF